MSKQAGGRPAKSGTRRELKTFRLVPDAIEHLERLASERGGSTSDVLNELLLEAGDEPLEGPRLEILGASLALPAVARFRLLPGGGKGEESDPRVAHELERLRDALGSVLVDLESLMAEQHGARVPRQSAKRDVEYATGFKHGMLEALETAYALLQSELLISEM